MGITDSNRSAARLATRRTLLRMDLVAADVLRPSEFDGNVAALIQAIGWIARGWTPAQAELHPKGRDGKFTTVADRIAGALYDHIKGGGGKGDPLSDFNREQVRKTAVAHGLKPRRGAPEGEIKKLLIDKARSEYHGARPLSAVDHQGRAIPVPSKEARDRTILGDKEYERRQAAKKATTAKDVKPAPRKPAKAPAKKTAKAALAKAAKPDDPPPKSVTKWHPAPTQAESDLYRLSQEPVVERISAGNPNNGRTELLTTAGGRRLVYKIHENRGVRNLREMGDAEQLSSQVSTAVGVATPTFVRTGDHEWFTSLIHGTPGVDLVPAGGDIPTEIRDGTEGRRLGLLDLLVKNGDRNPANWYRDGDGNLVAYDHGFAFTPGESPKYFARRNEYFSGHFRETMDDQGPNDIPRAEAVAIRERLEGLRPEFVRLGREDWWQEMMGTMDQVLKWTRG